jgi:hypothetical protein
MNAMQEKEFPSPVHHSTLHAVDLVLLELVAGGGELLGHDVAQVHEVVEALLQGFESGGGVCERKRISMRCLIGELKWT